MKIVNFGSLNIDHVYQVETFVKPGETIASSRYDVHYGGKGLNQSIALARAGAHVHHAGQVGEDGQRLIDYLNQAGVDTSLVKVSNAPTGHAIIQVNKDGENCIIVEGGANQSIDLNHIDRVIKTCKRGDWLVLQNEINSITTILKNAYESKISIAYNPAPINVEVGKLPLEFVNILFLNLIEGMELSGEQMPTKIIANLLNAYPNIRIVLTLGEKGAIYADSLHKIEQNGFNVKAIDTTAAGDTFIGYFLSSLCLGEDKQTSLRIACKAASICIERNGAAETIPARSEVEASRT